MAIIQIPNLPGVTGLDGSELFEGVQAGSSVKITLNQMIAAARAGTPTTLPIPVSLGGTGVSTLTGYVNGNGTSPFTASPTIPNTDITGLGTMSTQNANAVAITGGTAAFTGVSSVTASSASAALTVTQTGSGNSFVVEDSTSPDSTPFIVDANGNVGIGTSSPAYKLDVSDSIATSNRLLFTRTAVSPAYIEMTPSGDNSASLAIWTRFGGYSKDFEILNRNILLAQATAGNVGIGTASPATRLDVNGTTTSTAFTPSGATVPANGLYLPAANTLGFATASNERMRIDSAGNVGIGVTPNAWGFSGNLDLPQNSSIAFRSSYGTILSNSYYNLANARFQYITTGYAAQYQIGSNGQHLWSSAPSGTAGTATTFTERFRIDVLGQLGIGGANYGSSGQTIVSAGSGAAPAWGTLPVAGGGTGAITLTGYVKGTGTTAFTASATIPNTDVSGLGTMSTQAASAVAITGGAINGTTVGATTASTGAFTTLSASSTVSGTGFSTYLASPPAIGGTTAASVTGAPLVSTTVVTDGFVTLAAGTLALAFASKGVVQVTPNATATFTTTIPPAGTRCTLIVLTSGTTSYTMTFGTGFKTTGTLATGTVTAQRFVFQFISDGTSVIEASRTVAIA
jgi:hypothetical protein